MHLDAIVIATLEQVAAGRGIELPAPALTHTLTGDLGLRSLDLAHVIAILEAELGADPFARLVPITSIRTVGDLVEAYRKCLAGEPPSDAAVQEQAEAAQRGQTRRAATARRKESA